MVTVLPDHRSGKRLTPTLRPSGNGYSETSLPSATRGSYGTVVLSRAQAKRRKDLPFAISTWHVHVLAECVPGTSHVLTLGE